MTVVVLRPVCPAFQMQISDLTTIQMSAHLTILANEVNSSREPHPRMTPSTLHAHQFLVPGILFVMRDIDQKYPLMMETPLFLPKNVPRCCPDVIFLIIRGVLDALLWSPGTLRALVAPHLLSATSPVLGYFVALQ